MMLDYSHSQECKSTREVQAESCLLPCPVCGGKAGIWFHPQRHEPDRPYVRCDGCGLMTADSYYTVSHGYDLAFASIILRWNRRRGMEPGTWDTWNAALSKFDENWKIPHYSQKFFDGLFLEMRQLVEEQVCPHCGTECFSDSTFCYSCMNHI